MKTALITGITGQDGYFLTQFLLLKGYEVYGIVRRNSSKKLESFNTLPEQIQNNIHILQGDVIDANFVGKTIQELKPDELYHLAAQSFVGSSFTDPSYTYDANISGTLNVANAIKDYSKNTRLYFAATSELFGKATVSPQNEETPFYPISPYAISKLAGFWVAKNYRETYNIFMSNGILFNHESERRPKEFVTKKISSGVARIYKGSKEPIELGNLDAVKDWGYAPEYVEGMWKMLNYNKPDDFIFGTGEAHTVREFAHEAFKAAGIEVHWEGSGLDEKCISDEGKILVKVNKEFFRPLDTNPTIADYSKARSLLNWFPKTSFKDLVKIMVSSDLKM